MSASTIKIPDPIIEPITSAVELKRPRVGTNLGELGATEDSGMRVSFGVTTY
jgi:hypothetical protein